MANNANLISVERYIFPTGSNILVDSNGLLVNPPRSPSDNELISASNASELPGGILLAEGGMGKTTFMEQMKGLLLNRSVHLFKLGEYVGDPRAFIKDLEMELSESSVSEPQTVLLDGLDEAPDLAGSVLRSIRKLPGCTRVWISSRDIVAIRTIQSERPQLVTYSLAPLSESDLRTLAVQAAVDADEFMNTVARQALLPICAKPLGCELVLSVFRENRLIDVPQRDLWRRGIEKLCDETPSPTRKLIGAPKFTLEKVLHCSSWISLCLALSGNHFVWNGEQSNCPPQSLGISDLTWGSFSSDLIRTALERGVFSPLGDGRVVYSHSIYRDYLAAFGFALFIPSEHWISLLTNGRRDTVLPQRAGIAPWLATYNKTILAKLSDIQPELLLGSADTIQAIGPDRLCDALIERANGLSYLQRRNLSNLHRLKGGRTPDVLRTRLLDPEAGPGAIELAIAVVKACDYAELAGLLADRVFEVGLSLRERVDAAYAVCRLKDDAAKMRLKELLPIDPATDQQDDLRGTVLRACWPAHLSPDEIVMHLTEPQKPNYFGAYSSFLNYDLPVSFESELDESNAEVMLTWALQHINENDTYDFLGRLSRIMYTNCWRFTKNPAVAKLLAIGYVKAISVYQSPFLQRPNEVERMTLHAPTRDAFLEDVDGRLIVLTAILIRGDIQSYQLEDIPFNDYPLYTQDDLPALFDRATADPSGPLAEQWAICIKAVLSRAGLNAYSDKVDRLHALRPDLIDNSHKLQAEIEAASSRANDLVQKLKKADEDRTKKHTHNQDQIDNEIKKALHSSDLKPESFVCLSSLLNSQNGIRSILSIDIQLSPGWALLTVEERGVMLDLAHRYIAEADIPPTSPNQHQHSVACALTALRLLKPSLYTGLSHEVWRKCGVELLKAAMDDNLELLSPLFDTLSEQFPEVATDAVLAVLSQELQGDCISIISNWGRRLSDGQAKAILAIAAEPKTDLDRSFAILSDLARHGKDSVVRAHLDSVFSSGWDVQRDSTMHRLLSLAFALSPASYIRQILDSLAADSVWGRQWIEVSVEGHDNAVLNSLLACDVCDIAEIYIWLNEQYPPETYPEHTGAYALGPLDEIHMIKNQLINHLTQSGKDGSAAAIQTIVDRFPIEAFLTSCVIDARTAEQANNSPVLPIAQIKELCKKRSASHYLVNSVEDLLEITMASLEAYQTYLQGDTPAVVDLWNNSKPTIRPKDEEHFSDHLKRFLEGRLTTDVIVNREVQIRRKQFKDGVSGSRTDIWIQATDKDGYVLTLCIEVKCNWNKSSTTALQDQLVGKYMSGGTATAGILLLGWFECVSWDETDGRLVDSRATWVDRAVALADLRGQADTEQKAGNNVQAFVLDCGLR